MIKAVCISISAILLVTGCKDSDQPIKTPATKGSTPVPSAKLQSTNSISQEQPQPNKPKLEIWEAASLGAIEIVNEHLDAGVDVNSLDKRGRTPLHWASTEKVIKKLIAKGSDLNAKDGRGMTPLHCYIIENKKTEEAKILLDAGAKVNATTSSGHTPLHYATSNNKFNFVDFLIQNGANTNAKSNSGVTPLHSASLSDDNRIIELLLNKEAQVNALTKDGVKLFATGTPLDWAQKANKEKAISLLRKNGAKTAKELKTK